MECLLYFNSPKNCSDELTTNTRDREATEFLSEKELLKIIGKVTVWEKIGYDKRWHEDKYLGRNETVQIHLYKAKQFS
jgi:hypothetical protein